jgi:hypothetical protein
VGRGIAVGLGDKFGSWDDQAIYRANDPEQRVHWGRLLLVKALIAIVFCLGLAIGRATLGEGWFLAILGVGLVVFFAWYIPWRRRRNATLRGSPTEWPSN